MATNRRELEGYRFEHSELETAIERNKRTGFDPVAARLQDKALITNQKGIETMSAQPTGTLRIEKGNSNGASDPTPASLPQFTINVLVDGFPVKIEASGRAEQLVAIIAKLREAGATPPAWAVSTVTPASALPTDEPPAPKCPVHKWDMKKSKFNDDYYCGACSQAKKK
jgi:hypothetical protein